MIAYISEIVARTEQYFFQSNMLEKY